MSLGLGWSPQPTDRRFSMAWGGPGVFGAGTTAPVAVPAGGRRRRPYWAPQTRAAGLAARRRPRRQTTTPRESGAQTDTV